MFLVGLKFFFSLFDSFFCYKHWQSVKIYGTEYMVILASQSGWLISLWVQSHYGVFTRKRMKIEVV